MLRYLILPALILVLNGPAVGGESFPPEIVEAYTKGQADWDRGDPISAMPKLRIAAEGGHPIAQYLLAYTLDQADDDDEAAKWYQKSAELGYTDGMFGLAAFLLSGDGGVTIDVAKAKSWFARAAETGHQQSIAVMVMAYLEGGLGLTEAERQSSDALKWLLRGSEIDHSPSLERLLIAHRDGHFGLPINVEESKRIQARLYELQGVDPTQIKRRRQRR